VNLDAYEVVRRLPAGGLASVEVVHRLDRPREPLVLKAVRPALLFARPEECQRTIDHFLERARLQQRMGQADPDHWVSVEAHGPIPDGAACVTAYHDLSVRQLARGRTRLTLRDVAAVIGGVVEGLRSLQETAGRPHGNLKAANVLVAGRGRIGERVALVDPLADSLVDPVRDRLADLRALADLIHRLVLHRGAPRGGVGRVASSEAWTRLGGGGEALRRLCNRLMAPDLDPAQLPLEEVAREVDRLARRPRVSPRTWMAAALAVAVVAALIIWLSQGETLPDEVLPEEWPPLCAEYHDWFFDLLGNVGPPDAVEKAPFRVPRQDVADAKTRRVAWRKDAHLAAVVEAVDDFIGKSFMPTALSEESDVRVDTLAEDPSGHPPRYDRATHRRVHLAYEAVRHVKQYFKPIGPDQRPLHERWPVLERFDRTKEAWRGRGWVRRADYLREPVANLDPCFTGSDDRPRPEWGLADTVDAILARAANLKTWNIEANYAACEACLRAIEKAEDRAKTPLADFADFVQQQTAEGPSTAVQTAEDPSTDVQQDLAALADRLKAWTAPDGLATRMERFAEERWPKIHHEAVLAYLPALPAATGEQRFDHWLKAVSDGTYDIIPTETVTGPARTRLTVLAGALEAVETQRGDWPETLASRWEDALKRYGEELDDLEQRKAAFADRVVALEETWCEKKRKKEEYPGQALVKEIDGAVAEARFLARRIVATEVAAVGDLVGQAVRPALALWPTPAADALRKQVDALETARSGLADRLDRIPPGQGIPEADRAKVLADLAALRAQFQENVWKHVDTCPAAVWHAQDWEPRKKRIEAAVKGLDPETKQKVLASLDTWAAGYKAARSAPFDATSADDRDRVKAADDALARDLTAIEGLIDPRRFKEWADAIAATRGALDAIDATGLRVAGLADPAVLKGRVEALVAGVGARLGAIEATIKKVPTGPYQDLSVADKQAAETHAKAIKAGLASIGTDRAVEQCQTAFTELKTLAVAVAALLEAKPPVEETVFATLWNRERRRIAASAVANLPEPAAVVPAGFGTQRTQRLAAGRDQLTRLVEVVGGAFSPATGQPLLQKERARRLAGAVAGFGDALDYAALPAADAPAEDWRKALGLTDAAGQWQAVVKGLSALEPVCTSIAAGLAAGLGLDESPAGRSEKIGDLCDEAVSNPAFEVQEVKDAYDDPVSRVGVLKKIQGTTDSQKLLAWTRDPAPTADHFEHARAAWLALGRQADWPADADALAAERDVRRRLRQAIPAANTAMREDLDRRGRWRWVRCVDALGAAGPLEEAIDAAEEFDLTGGLANLRYVPPGRDESGADTASSERVRYNVLLYRFRKDLESPAAGQDAPKRLRDAFVKLAGELAPGMAGREPVKGFLGKVQAAREEADSTGADLEAAGPGTARWTVDPQSTRDLVVYTLKDAGGRAGTGDGRPLTLRFRLVRAAGAPKGCYLCTTEVSMGLFRAVMDQKAAWRDPRVTRWLQEVGNPTKPLQGPRGWHMSEDFQGNPETIDFGYAAPDRWVWVPAWYGQQGLDPERVRQSPPSAGHPMHRIPPHLALYFARLLGCRLPTSREWAAAYASMKATPGGWNRSDRAWAQQKAHAADVEKRVRGETVFGDMPCYPDEAIFRPAGTSVPERNEAQPAEAADDGVLWFAKVDADADHPFHHLVGNVAEYACDRAGTETVAADTDAVYRLVTSGAAAVHVVGASALSPKQIRPDVPYPCRVGDDTYCFSDVGFRLAFTAPRATLRQILIALVEEEGGYRFAPAASP